MVGSPPPPLEDFLRLTRHTHSKGCGSQSYCHCDHSQATSLPVSSAPRRGGDVYFSDKLESVPTFLWSQASWCLSSLLLGLEWVPVSPTPLTL